MRHVVSVGRRTDAPTTRRTDAPTRRAGRTVSSSDTRGSDLPNPWHRVAPPCPYAGHPPAVVYLWHPAPGDGFGRWFCSPCGRRFD